MTFIYKIRYMDSFDDDGSEIWKSRYIVSFDQEKLEDKHDEIYQEYLNTWDRLWDNFDPKDYWSSTFIEVEMTEVWDSK